MKYLLMIALSMLILEGCIKEEMTVTTVRLKNVTDHKLRFSFFTAGSENLSKKIELENNEDFIIESRSDFGKMQTPLFWGEYFIDIDSVQIWWDELYCITHMISGPYASGWKYSEYGAIDNLTHPESYETLKVKETKSSISWLLIREFTESDYEYAKE